MMNEVKLVHRDILGQLKHLSKALREQCAGDDPKKARAVMLMTAVRLDEFALVLKERMKEVKLLFEDPLDRDNRELRGK